MKSYNSIYKILVIVYMAVVGVLLCCVALGCSSKKKITTSDYGQSYESSSKAEESSTLAVSDKYTLVSIDSVTVVALPPQATAEATTVTKTIAKGIKITTLQNDSIARAVTLRTTATEQSVVKAETKKETTKNQVSSKDFIIFVLLVVAAAIGLHKVKDYLSD